MAILTAVAQQIALCPQHAAKQLAGHLILMLDHANIGFVGAGGFDQLDHLNHRANGGLFEHVLPNLPLG